MTQMTKTRIATIITIITQIIYCHDNDTNDEYQDSSYRFPGGLSQHHVTPQNFFKSWNGLQSDWLSNPHG